jgi:RNA polymerase sigma-70 factor (ECF subfamily)
VQIEQNVILAQGGDREAFIRLVKGVELNLYGVARSMVKRDEDCADAIQETILKAYQAIRTLREPVYFKSWIFRILINECNQILRGRKRTLPAESASGQASSGCEYENVDTKDAVGRLDEPLRMVVLLYYFEDMPLKQIAELLGVSEGTVKSRLHRARLMLAEWLGIPEERKIGNEG